MAKYQLRARKKDGSRGGFPFPKGFNTKKEATATAEHLDRIYPEWEHDVIPMV